MKTFLAAALALTLALPATAADPAKTIEPWLDPEALVLAHADVSKVNADAILDWLVGMGVVPAEDMAEARVGLKKFPEAFLKAGGTEVFYCLNPLDIPKAAGYLIVPVPQGRDGKEMATLLRSMFRKPAEKGQPFDPTVAEVVESLGPVVFVGGKDAFERVKPGKATARPEVAKAFAALEGTAVQGMLLPTDDCRRVITEILPTLPKQVGGFKTSVILEGARWAAVGLNMPPEMKLHVVIQSSSEAAADDFRKLTLLGLGAAAIVPDVRKTYPNILQIVGLLTPKQEGDRLHVRLQAKELEPLLQPAVVKAREAAERQARANSLKQIGLAMHNYLDSKGTFPAPANYDASGKPLLSWRVHLLPYLEGGDLYKEFHLDEPWDSEHNKKLIARMPKVFQSGITKLDREHKTRLLVPLGPSTIFPGKEGVKIQSITDGTSNTILAVEVDDKHAVIWTRPDDLKVNFKKPLEPFQGGADDYFQVLFADGSVRVIKKSVDPQTMSSLYTRDGGEVVSLP